MKTKIQIINETAKYYSVNPSKRRAINDGVCAYYIDGRKCAVGRCARNPDGLPQGTVLSLFDRGLTDEGIFFPRFQGHEKRFWADLQALHDDSIYWEEMGLSKWGKNKITELKKKWANK